MDLSKVGRALLQGRGEAPQTIETEGQMLQRACGELMALKNVVVLNDEAHHCYREKAQSDEESELKGEEKEEAKKNNEAARLWISGIEALKRKVGVRAVYDLSATPFFLRGSGYAEGTLFPWTVSDFSLMDAIECGIVKLPRVPVADNLPGNEMPIYRNLWEHIGKEMPKKGRGKSGRLDPLSLPNELQTALHALYGHYEKTFELWKQEGIEVPPLFRWRRFRGTGRRCLETRRRVGHSVGTVRKVASHGRHYVRGRQCIRDVKPRDSFKQRIAGSIRFD
jgi:type III restriction enzyme